MANSEAGYLLGVSARSDTARIDPATAEVFPLGVLARERLNLAQSSSEGRSAMSLHEGEVSVLRQTVTALLAGRSMVVEHPPDEAWILVLSGRIAVSTDEAPPVSATGTDLVRLPRTSHVVLAEDDTVMLLAVAKGERPQ